MTTDQEGYSLPEVLVGLAVTSLLMSLLVMGVFRAGQGLDAPNSQITANRRIENAAAFISGDIEMARYSNLVDDPDVWVSTLTLSWNDYYQEPPLTSGMPAVHTSTYSLVGGALRRNFDGAVTTVVTSGASVEFSLDGSLITVRLTVTATEGPAQSTVVKTYRFNLRPQG